MAKTKKIKEVVEEVKEVDLSNIEVVSKIGQINVDFNQEGLNILRDKVNELIKRENER